MPHLGQIGSDLNPIDFDAWSELISGQDGFRMDPWEGRDPATGMPTEQPASAMRVKYVPEGTPVGMLAYDEEHRSIIVLGDEEIVTKLTELATRFASDLGSEFVAI